MVLKILRVLSRYNSNAKVSDIWQEEAEQRAKINEPFPVYETYNKTMMTNILRLSKSADRM